ncbi:2-hydroxyacid dehydrogenase [Pelagibacterium montanilacus]|uniref:2-hydroxyacid dehydrogenase n=1 Tax=Pelagibacterium montanilacus TaxID=2185280 RepID=UPI000F8CB866|nr:glyoxylate/hydroxypyruvate reductase A [Pelagibacterium montanilacus]
MALLLHLADVNEHAWAERFRSALGNYPVLLRSDSYDPDDIRYIFAWKPSDDAFDGFNHLKAVLSLGAGVDALLQHPRLPEGVPIVRFVDDELTQCMSDYVIASVTMHQRLFSRYAAHQKARIWSQLYPPPATAISVGIMGMGQLGVDAARKLVMLGFKVNGWSRTEKHVDGVTRYAGDETFDAFLGATDILVNLLPLTADTRGILNYATFKKLRRGTLIGGPVVVNAARGGHQKEADIIKALEDGTLSAASLDVFETEPLPKDSPLWTLENCFVTPHIAAISSERNGARYFSQMLLDHEAGKPLRNVVDRERGY